MSQNISGYGLSISMIASNTFPVGVLITDLVEDTDPFDIPELTIGEAKGTPNGKVIYWANCNPIMVNIAVIPNSYSDIQLAILLENNRPGENKVSNYDSITLSAIYPNNPEATLILSDGFILSGTPSTGMSGSGRQKSKTYGFAFGGKTGGL